ncbi:MAG TPA: LCP family protein [Candidatus Limnocylindrales bacterium]|nr:LCP family protein [Candidatus Limnocylindrales bacterium]
MLHRLVPAGHRSAFAACFLSFVFPGLGQAYAGLARRALIFAVLPALGLVALLLAAATPTGRTQLLASLASPTFLLTLLALDVGLLFYRALAVVDAYRAADAASDPSTSPGRELLPPIPSRILSLAGLGAVLLVLAGGHLAVARFDLLAYDLVTGITTSRPTFPSANPQGGLPGQGGSPTPGDSAGASGTARPSGSTDTRPTPPAGGRSSPTDGSSGAAPSAATPPATPLSDTPQPSTPAQWDGSGRLNVLLVGSDSHPELSADHYLTDTLIVASVDPQTKAVAMFSVPRDTIRVPLPASWPAYAAYGGSFPYKINTLWYRARQNPQLFPGDDADRGYVAIKGAIGELLGLPIHYFVEVNFEGFKTVVDTVGGVTVDVQVPVSDDHYPAEDGRGSLNIYIPPGIQHMDGAQALAYARARTKTSDFDRAGRQQRLVRALRDRVDLASLLVPGRLEALVGALKEAIRTDVPAEMLPRLITLGQEVDVGRARSLVFSPPRYGTECLECYNIRPNVQAIRMAVEQAIAPDPAASASREALVAEGAVIWVADGGSGPERASATAAYLAASGLSASVPTTVTAPPAPDTDTASVTVYNGAEWRIPETLGLLERIFGVEAITASDPAVAADVVVTTGPTAPALAPAQ